MPRVDLPTFFMVSTALFILMAGMFFITWRQDRSANAAMLHWAVAHLLGAPACVLLALRGEVAAWLSIGVANLLVLVAFGLLLSGALTFEGRRGRAVAVAVPATVWIVLAQIPAVSGDFSARVILVSLMIFTLAASSAVVIWRGRHREPLPSRTIVAILLAFVASAHLSRLMLTASAPPSESFAVLGTGWTAFIAMQILLQEVVLGYALLSMVKERGEARQRQTAEVDSLTGVLTRRAFFARAAARLAADPSRGAVLIFDLDRFKAINDTHGHLVGDRVLADFAGVVSSRIGPRDVFGRFGGEEFVLFLADADFSAAWRVAEAVRRDFSGLEIRNGVRVVDATVSVGVSAVPLVEPDLDRLVASADAGLYAAKQSGRDRVETVAEPVRRAPRSERAV
jgi:diguanylate cyclase (GGDEF)-like protein